MDSFEFEALFGSLAKADAPVAELPDPVGLDWEPTKKSASAGRNVSHVLREYFGKDVCGDIHDFETPTDTALRKMKAREAAANENTLQKRAKCNCKRQYTLHDGTVLDDPTITKVGAADDFYFVLEKDGKRYMDKVGLPTSVARASLCRCE
jgi:hypothetical protein